MTNPKDMPQEKEKDTIEAIMSEFEKEFKCIGRHGTLACGKSCIFRLKHDDDKVFLRSALGRVQEEARQEGYRAGFEDEQKCMEESGEHHAICFEKIKEARQEGANCEHCYCTSVLLNRTETTASSASDHLRCCNCGHNRKI